VQEQPNKKPEVECFLSQPSILGSRYSFLSFKISRARVESELRTYAIATPLRMAHTDLRHHYGYAYFDRLPISIIIRRDVILLKHFPGLSQNFEQPSVSII